MAALGIDPFRYLTTRDEIEGTLLVELYNRTLKEREKLDHNLAVAIANQVALLFKRR